MTDGSVAETLTLMCGVWHDHLVAYDIHGAPITFDEHGSVPAPYPYDNLVYIDFDGVNYRQTNVTFRGRPVHTRSFRATVTNGVLEFETLGPDDPGHVGVSGGSGVIFFVPRDLSHPALQVYSEPDHIRLLGAQQRTRTTVLYRGGTLVRTLTVSGTKIAATAERRVAFDPRGLDGPVHEERSTTKMFQTGRHE